MDMEIITITLRISHAALVLDALLHSGAQAGIVRAGQFWVVWCGSVR